MLDRGYVSKFCVFQRIRPLFYKCLLAMLVHTMVCCCCRRCCVRSDDWFYYVFVEIVWSYWWFYDVFIDIVCTISWFHDVFIEIGYSFCWFHYVFIDIVCSYWWNRTRIYEETHKCLPKAKIRDLLFYIVKYEDNCKFTFPRHRKNHPNSGGTCIVWHRKTHDKVWIHVDFWFYDEKCEISFAPAKRESKQRFYH